MFRGKLKNLRMHLSNEARSAYPHMYVVSEIVKAAYGGPLHFGNVFASLARRRGSSGGWNSARLF